MGTSLKINLEDSLKKTLVLKEVPHIIKYMGSKSSLLEYIVDSINEIYEGEIICDLFAGTAVLSGALGHSVSIYSNDIQEYSAVLAKTYLGDYDWRDYENIFEDVIKIAKSHVDRIHNVYPNLVYEYETDMGLDEFNEIEQQQQNLIHFDFEGFEHHLFIKNYSGTYWSFEQCLWIDAIRLAAEKYSDSPVYNCILSSLMFAMAYNAQSTGHYAQYRDANNIASMRDIINYRNKEITPYFKKKLEELIKSTGSNSFNHTITSLDYRKCLDLIPNDTLVYADPPYAFVHYSRFYHALETLIKYDYPDVAYKGRYRTDRHQSPFCRRTEVVSAFEAMFQKIKMKKSKLVLSYSNTGIITLEKILELARNIFGNEYEVYSKAIDYTHSTMGRSNDKSREVKEYLVIANRIHNG